MQVCTSLQTDNHASTPPLGFLQAGCPSCRPTNSVKALKAIPPYTHIPFNGPFSGNTRVSRYQKGKTDLDFTEARDSEWQWHQLGHMQVWTSLQTDNHANTHRSVFLQAGCPSCRPTNSVKALKANNTSLQYLLTVGPKLTRPASRAAATTIDQYLLRARARPQQQTRRLLLLSTGQTDGRTDGETLNRFMTLTADRDETVKTKSLPVYCWIAINWRTKCGAKLLMHRNN